MRRIAVALVACVCLVAAAAGVRAETVTVFAAASLKTAFDAIGEAFEAETGVRLVASYAGTSVLARQIEQGAPADVFASANDAWTDHLVDRGSLDPTSVVPFAGNRLVLIAPSTQTPDTVLDLSPDALLPSLGPEGRVAVALVDAVPAGVYAREAMMALGLWEALEDRLAQTDNVRSALVLVARGEAPLGVVYASDVEASEDVSVVAEVPESAHSPIRYTASRVAASGSPAAERFLTFLQSSTAQLFLAVEGFEEVR